jgi:hypothetical protein
MWPGERFRAEVLGGTLETVSEDPLHAALKAKRLRRRWAKPEPEEPEARPRGIVTQGARTMLEPPPFRRRLDTPDALLREAAELARSRVEIGRIENR